MLETKYLIRLDDACPYMDSKKWQHMEEILDKYNIKPLVGIIPANADPQTMIDDEDLQFWDKVHQWVEKGWKIALHGYNHVHVSEDGMKGFNPVWKRSEFAGLSLDRQRNKIKKGIEIFKEHAINPDIFFAPSHTFDINTIEALRLESEIRVISDTISLKPYYKLGFLFIPQFSGHCVKIPFPGVYTFCFHPNNMDDKAFKMLELFLEANYNYFSRFEFVIHDKYKNKRMVDKFVSWMYFTFRKNRRVS